MPIFIQKIHKIDR